MAQQSLEEAFHATLQTEFDQDYWNRFVREIAARLRGLDGIKIAWEEVSRQGIDVALARINETLAPAAERIRNLTELGFLVAASETPATLGEGEVFDLVVVEGAGRELFTPSPFLLLGRALSADDYGVAKLRSYDRDTGVLQVEVVSFAGAPGPHSDWSIGALAGSTLAQLLLLDQGRAIQADVVARSDDVAAKHAEVNERHADVVALSEGATGAGGFDARITALETAALAHQAAAEADAWFFSR